MAAPEPVWPASDAVVPPGGSRPDVLIVEDHADTLAMLARLLGRRGLVCRGVDGGAGMVEALRSGAPCCLILDEAMPGMTGLEVLRWLRARAEYRDVPVLFYTASFDRSKEAEARALGARGWYIKGIARLEELAARVSEICAGGDAA